MALEITRLFFPKKLKNRFPTKLETLRAFLYEKQNYSNENQKKSSNSIIADVVGKKIQKIYANAGVKTLRRDLIAGKVMKAYKSRLYLLKFPRCQRYTKLFLEKKKRFESVMGEILQVADTKDVERKRKTKRKSNVITENNFLDDSENDAQMQSTEDDKDPDYEPLSDVNSFAGTGQTDLTEIVEVQSRFSYSARGTAAIVNATLKTFKIPVIIDKSKLQRAQKLTLEEMKEKSTVFGGGLYYDSRKDVTMIQTPKLGENGKLKSYRSIMRQEHYSLVAQPNDLFMGFVNTKDGGAKSASEAILSFIKDKNITNDLTALGSDGANTNIGGDGGINSFIEVALKRPLHWFVCMLHANELPLKNLILKLDGKTTGRNSFSGPIGKAIEQISRPTIIADFKPFKGSQKLEQLPVVVYKKLSNDQKYLFRIVNALITGEFSDDLRQLKVGNLCHSRWLTTASRICLLYASSEKPSVTLKILTSYIVDVYAPTWFQIKKNELAINGPKNLFFLIERSNLIVDDKAKTIVRECIQRNAFFAHSENMLLAQLASSNISERNDGVKKILEIRNRKDNMVVRRFSVPEINFKAKTWPEILLWDGPKMTEPPFTFNMTKRMLLNVIKAPLQVPLFKCHTQMVERAVKEVTRVSLNAIDKKKQEFLVKATLVNRAKYPKFDSKKDHIAQSHGNFVPKI